MLGFGYIDASKKRELWKEFSEKIEGNIEVRHTVSNTCEILVLGFEYKGVKVEFRESDNQPLKVFFARRFTKRCSFSLSSKAFIDKLMKRIGLIKYIRFDNEHFDKLFIFQSNDESMAKKILTKDVVEHLIKLNPYSLTYATVADSEKLEFSATFSRHTNDLNKLMDIYSLICLLIDRSLDNKVI